MSKSLWDSEYNEGQKRYERRSDFAFFAIIIALFLLFTSVRQWWTQSVGAVIVDGNSMNRTLKHDDRLLMLYSDGNNVERGEVIVVYVGDYEECGNTEYIIKRLIAKEGDKVRCIHGVVQIIYAGQTEWTSLDEPYAYYGNDYNKYDYNFSEYEVGENEIFFLGDNRSRKGSSIDSRYKEEGGSHLDRLYKATDIFGVVPEWAIRNRDILQFLFR